MSDSYIRSPQNLKWERLFRTVDGHTFYRDAVSCLVAIADQSIRVRNRPDTTDDGLLIVNREAPLTLVTFRDPANFRHSNFRLIVSTATGKRSIVTVSTRAAVQIADELTMVLHVDGKELIVASHYA